jgi:hypothetical protein
VKLFNTPAVSRRGVPSHGFANRHGEPMMPFGVIKLLFSSLALVSVLHAASLARNNTGVRTASHSRSPHDSNGTRRPAVLISVGLDGEFCLHANIQ